MFFLFFILCFMSTVQGMENDNSSYPLLKKDEQNFIIMYQDIDYVLSHKNIDHNSSLACTFAQSFPVPLKYNCFENSADTVVGAITPFKFDEPLDILNYFFEKNFSDLWELNNIYVELCENKSLCVTESFLSSFYCCLILKRFFHDPSSFQLKTYLLDPIHVCVPFSLGTSEPSKSKDIALTRLLLRYVYFISYKKDVVIGENKSFDGELLDFFVRKLYVLNNDTLDLSYVPIVDVMEKNCLNKIEKMSTVELKDIKTVNVFCNFTEKNHQDIISSIHKMRALLPNLNKMCFMDDNTADFFSQRSFDPFWKLIFYLNEKKTTRKPVDIFLKKDIYDTTVQEHIRRSYAIKGIGLSAVSMNSVAWMIATNIFIPLFFSAYLVILYDLYCCKKNIDFASKFFLFGTHLYMLFNDHLRMLSCAPMMLLLYVYGQWSNFPNIAKMPYGNLFLISFMTLSCSSFCVDFYCYWKATKTYDENEIKASFEYNEYVFPYDSKNI